MLEGALLGGDGLIEAAGEIPLVRLFLEELGSLLAAQRFREAQSACVLGSGLAMSAPRCSLRCGRRCESANELPIPRGVGVVRDASGIEVVRGR